MSIRVGGLGVERDVADPVAGQQRDPRLLVELGVQAAVALGVGEVLQLKAHLVGEAPAGLDGPFHEVLQALERIELRSVGARSYFGGAAIAMPP